MKIIVLVFILFTLAGILAIPTLRKNNDKESSGERIVGGSDAPEGKYPYQVSIRSNGVHQCGGSIIKPTIILTAAHCCQGVSSSSLTVVVGSNYLHRGGQIFSVKDKRSHDDYNPFTIQNDIALLKLSSSIEYGDGVQPIELDKAPVGVGVGAVLTGWGYTGYPHITTTDALQQLSLKTISNAKCKEQHESYKDIFESQICTFTKRGEGACQGDSGGPLVANGRQIGVVSWGRPCAADYPDVFTSVAYYHEWIRINSY